MREQRTIKFLFPWLDFKVLPANRSPRIYLREKDRKEGKRNKKTFLEPKMSQTLSHLAVIKEVDTILLNMGCGN